jgi:starch phosphorylase
LRAAFATYKRPNLLLHDPERLLRLLSNPQRPVQLMIAGKAHPADKEGQALIKEWIQFIRRPEVRPHAIFLSDYDMQLTERLVQGVDVWLNTPRRPWEACGTSGMKVLVNGGLNLSELDGWWAEAYVSDLGWAIGDGKEHGNDPLGTRPKPRRSTSGWNARSFLNFIPQRERHSHGLGQSDARKHGAVDPALCRRPHGARIYRTTLSSGSDCLPITRCQQRYYRQARWLIGGTVWIRNGPRYTFGQVKVETKGDQHIFEVQVCLHGLDPRRCAWSSMPTDSKAILPCDRK